MKSKRIQKSLFLLFSMLLLLPCITYATTLLFKDLDALIKEADGIMAGTVNRIEYYYDKEGDISTLIHLTALDILAGEYDEPELIISQKGGKMGNDVYYIDGSPLFTEGDRVIVFLKDNGMSKVPFAGWEQGVFKIKYSSEFSSEGIVDANDNPVFGINKNLILKETKNSRAFLVYQQDTFSGYSDDNNESSRLLHIDNKKRIMKASDFLSGLKEKIRNVKVKTTRKIKSVSINTLERGMSTEKRQQADVPAPYSGEPLEKDKAAPDTERDFLPQSSMDKE